MKKLQISFTLFVLGILLSLAITIQLKVANNSESKYSQTKITDNLKDQILELNDENTKMSQKLINSTNELQKIRDEAAENDSSNIKISELIKKYTILLGYTEVNGEGVQIKYIPNKDEQVSDTAKDLRDIINEVKNAGIEAISINGQRLVNTSSIEMVKNKIEVNGEVISKPYTIQAIGNSEIIYSGLVRPGGTIENIKYTGVKIEINTSNNIRIPKFSEIYE